MLILCEEHHCLHWIHYLNRTIEFVYLYCTYYTYYQSKMLLQAIFECDDLRNYFLKFLITDEFNLNITAQKIVNKSNTTRIRLAYYSLLWPCACHIFFHLFLRVMIPFIIMFLAPFISLSICF